MSGPVVCFGEMLLRYSPAVQGQGLSESAAFAVHVAGAEANVAISLASLGQAARMVSVLPGNALGEKVRRTLIAHGVDARFCSEAAGRLGTYYVEDPAGGREGGFFYDRAGSAFASAGPGAVDWAAALEGASLLHLSGITAALGEGPLALLHEGIDAAEARGIAVSFDCNYRPLLWAGREEEAAATLLALARRAELIFASGRDEHFLFAGAPPAGGLFDVSQRARAIATTARRESGAGEELGASVRSRSARFEVGFAPIVPNIERVGAGDAFAAGLIYALSQYWPLEDCAAFAHRACLMKHAVPGDFSTFSAEQVKAAL